MKEGIDAVIVDNVLAIRKGLTENEGETQVEGAALKTPQIPTLPEEAISDDDTTALSVR